MEGFCFCLGSLIMLTGHLPIKTGANAQTKGDLSILATMAPFDLAVAQERDDGASIF